MLIFLFLVSIGWNQRFSSVSPLILGFDRKEKENSHFFSYENCGDLVIGGKRNKE